MFIKRSRSPQHWLEREIRSIESELNPPFSVVKPAQRQAPFLFNSPHSGRTYPSAFINTSRLNEHALRSSEDFFVDKLFAPVVELGATLMYVNFPRAYLDVNRQPYELDPALFSEKLPDYANSNSLRVIGGLGTIPRLVNEQEEIYAAPLPLSVALERIKRLYMPYHEALRRIIEELRAGFGRVFLIDCHSMPSHLGEAVNATRADFVLGDRFGGSCAPEFVDFAANTLRELGYAVALNKPYAGGHITEEYGQPAIGVHALQIEVNRGLYMREDRFALTPGFKPLCDDLRTLSQKLIRQFGSASDSFRTAAE